MRVVAVADARKGCGGGSLFDCDESTERVIIEKHRDVFSREKNVLTVKGDKGTSKVYVGVEDRESPEGGAGPWYYVASYWPTHKAFLLLQIEALGESIIPQFVDLKMDFGRL